MDKFLCVKAIIKPLVGRKKGIFTEYIPHILFKKQSDLSINEEGKILETDLNYNSAWLYILKNFPNPIPLDFSAEVILVFIYWRDEIEELVNNNPEFVFCECNKVVGEGVFLEWISNNEFKNLCINNLHFQERDWPSQKMSLEDIEELKKTIKARINDLK